MKSDLRYLLLAIALFGVSLPLSAQQRIAFVSSASGNGDMSSWPQSGLGLQGLEAADSICVAQASAAGLANAANFKAWLSDSNDDAYCRLHNLGGKKADNCGQGTLPVAAGPWNRTDGLPWAGSVEQVFNERVVYMPMLMDENGSAVPIDHRAWQATGSTGAVQGGTCSDWSDDSPSPANALRLNYTAAYGDTASFCNTDVHLICAETGAGPPVELPEFNGNIAFLTSTSGSAVLSSWADAAPGTNGIEAGDSICNALAEQANLPFQGSYKAWLSDDSIDARDRFEHDGPWNRPDGIRIASTLADLTDGLLSSANHVEDTGQYDFNAGVWSGTQSNGTAHPENCGNWQSISGTAWVGRSGYTDAWWTDMEDANCFDTFYRLSCLSDVDFSPKRVFASSATGTADLGSWPEAADGLEGTAAADSICRSLATTAGLDNPQNFVAWLSDSNDDAYCRVQNLSGKVLNNCGESELPNLGGPWTRIDGVPAWSSLGDLMTTPAAFFSPVLIDENGAGVNRNENAWSATNTVGAVSSLSFTCSDWTNGSSASGAILPLHFNGWNTISFDPCADTSGHLVCVETGVAEKQNPPAPTGNIAFLSSATGSGDLASWDAAQPGTSGIAAGDSICNTLAEDAGLPLVGSYKAWLSDSTVSARDRFRQPGGWQRPDGIPIAENLDDLTDGGLFTAVQQTEQGDYFNFQSSWTGTGADGNLLGTHCEDWSSASSKDTAISGRTGYTIAGWTAFNSQNCDQQVFIHLYCLSDVELVDVFKDGFETP